VVLVLVVAQLTCVAPQILPVVPDLLAVGPYGFPVAVRFVLLQFPLVSAEFVSIFSQLVSVVRNLGPASIMVAVVTLVAMLLVTAVVVPVMLIRES
jgi:hypothetical protein